MTPETLWIRIRGLLTLDPTDPGWRAKHRRLRQDLHRTEVQCHCAEYLFLDAYASYMFRPDDDTTPSGDRGLTGPQRADALLPAVLALDPTHTGALMTLGYRRYDQLRYAEALPLFERADESDLEPEHQARRLEMMAACRIMLDDVEKARGALVALSTLFQTIPPPEYEPLNLSLLVASLVDAGDITRLGALRDELLRLDTIGGFSWFANELDRATPSPGADDDSVT